MTKVAIVFGNTIYDDYGSEFIAKSITDWAEVTEEEIRTLQQIRCTKDIGFDAYERMLIIYQPSSPQEETVITILSNAKVLQEKEEVKKLVHIKKMKEVREKKKLSQRDKDLKMFEDLKKKLESDLTK